LIHLLGVHTIPVTLALIIIVITVQYQRIRIIGLHICSRFTPRYTLGSPQQHTTRGGSTGVRIELVTLVFQDLGVLPVELAKSSQAIVGILDRGRHGVPRYLTEIDGIVIRRSIVGGAPDDQGGGGKHRGSGRHNFLSIRSLVVHGGGVLHIHKRGRVGPGIHHRPVVRNQQLRDGGDRSTHRDGGQLRCHRESGTRGRGRGRSTPTQEPTVLGPRRSLIGVFFHDGGTEPRTIIC